MDKPSAQTLDRMAALHRAAFVVPRPWTRAEIDALIATKGVFVVGNLETCMAMGRVIVDEVELLTLAVAPDHQGQGIGRTTLRAFEAAAQKRGAIRAFLEVAENNIAAHALYVAQNWHESGRRRAYYTTKDATKLDAILFEKAL